MLPIPDIIRRERWGMGKEFGRLRMDSGQHRRIIVVANGARHMLMHNPEILEAAGPYETEEGCLSLEGTRPCKRYRRIKVRYLDECWTERTFTFTGYVAEIIQHEIDHCNGVLI